MNRNTNAFALSGGGGKGAYQIGVLKALTELRLLDNVEAISGTSVGALNAVLYAVGDVELAEKIWLEIVSPETMLKKIDFKDGILSFSRDSIVQIIKYIGIEKIKNSIPVYVYVSNLENGSHVPFLLNDKRYDENKIIGLLLASSSLPVIYNPVSINGEKYIDGGFGSKLANNPVEILAQIGCKNITLITLDYYFNPYSVGKSKINLYSSFPDVDLDIIKPSYNIGGVDGIIDFKSESIAQRIAIGYNDAKNKYCKGSGTAVNVNDEIRDLASEVLLCSEDFEKFINFSHWKYINGNFRTMGGKYFYTNIYDCDGWRIQQHSGLIRNHYRIIDPQDVRRAWTMDPKEISANLILYRDKRNR